MKSFFWGVASVVVVIVTSLVLILVDIDAADVIYSMLAGSIVGLVLSVVAFAKGADAGRAMSLLFFGVVGAVIGWLVSVVLVRVATLSLYSTTALTFDLLVGVFGAASLCFFLLGKWRRADEKIN